MVAALVAACHTEQDETLRAEAGLVAHQVAAMRSCPAVNRPAFRKVLAVLPCTANDVCEVRNLCGAAYELEEKAHEAIAAIDHATESERRPSGDAQQILQSQAAELLKRTEEDLRRAKDLSVQCADREAELRRRYRL